MAATLPINDQTTYPEGLIQAPYAVSPELSWMEYRCWVEIELDPGLALHKTLPQKNDSPDDLSYEFVDDPNFATINPDSGVVVASNSTGQDAIQRMATSTYTFHLRGYAVRIGYQVPIPGLKSVGAQKAVPMFPQRASNMIVGNCGGVPLWFAYWDLTYMVAGPLGKKAVAPVPDNLASHIAADATLPQAIQFPWTRVDPRSQVSSGIGFVKFKGAQ